MMKFLVIGQQQTYSKNMIALHNVTSYLHDSLENNEWQNAIRKDFILEEKKESPYNPFIVIAIRFFDKRASKLKSYSRFNNKEECLNIDLVFFVEDYENFNENELLITFCEHLYPILEESLLKYKKRFVRFDIQKFIPHLKNRMEAIKNKKLPYEDRSHKIREYLNLVKELEEKIKKDE